METLKKQIQALLSQHTCRAGIVIIEQSSQKRLEINPEMGFPAASMIKVPIMIEIMRQAAKGKVSLDEILEVSDQVKVDGGILQELRSGLPMTLRELVTLMIVLSDNTATNILIDRFGMDAVNTAMRNFGLPATVLQRKMMDFAAAKAGRENLTTPQDMAFLFAGLLNHSLGLPAKYSDFMLAVLKRQQIRDKLPFYLPEDVVLANKTGTLPGAEHDGGILYVPRSPYIISIFTDGLAANYEGLQLVAKLGKLIYDFAA